MALYDVTEVNGVTKVETSTGYRYTFKLAKIETFTEGNYMVREISTNSKSELVRFADLSNVFGASTIEGYVDQLALRGEYGGKAFVEVTAGTTATAFETSALTALLAIEKRLEEVVFLLKHIAK